MRDDHKTALKQIKQQLNAFCLRHGHHYDKTKWTGLHLNWLGGFSNSDVLGSAKGWAGAFLYNPKAKEALDKFYAREDTLSLGIISTKRRKRVQNG